MRCLDMSVHQLTQPRGLLGLSRCLAPDHGPSGQSAWPLRTRPVPGTGRVSKGRGRARALAEELDDRVEAAVEDVLLDHERRCEDQDVPGAAAADEHAALPQRTPLLPGE